MDENKKSIPPWSLSYGSGSGEIYAECKLIQTEVMLDLVRPEQGSPNSQDLSASGHSKKNQMTHTHDAQAK